jgi:hypothetical protein
MPTAITNVWVAGRVVLPHRRMTLIPTCSARGRHGRWTLSHVHSRRRHEPLDIRRGIDDSDIAEKD